MGWWPFTKKPTYALGDEPGPTVAEQVASLEALGLHLTPGLTPEILRRSISRNPPGISPNAYGQTGAAARTLPPEPYRQGAYWRLLADRHGLGSYGCGAPAIWHEAVLLPEAGPVRTEVGLQETVARIAERATEPFDEDPREVEILAFARDDDGWTADVRVGERTLSWGRGTTHWDIWDDVLDAVRPPGLTPVDLVDDAPSKVDWDVVHSKLVFWIRDEHVDALRAIARTYLLPLRDAEATWWDTVRTSPGVPATFPGDNVFTLPRGYLTSGLSDPADLDPYAPPLAPIPTAEEREILEDFGIRVLGDVEASNEKRITTQGVRRRGANKHFFGPLDGPVIGLLRAGTRPAFNQQAKSVWPPPHLDRLSRVFSETASHATVRTRRLDHADIVRQIVGNIALAAGAVERIGAIDVADLDDDGVIAAEVEIDGELRRFETPPTIDPTEHWPKTPLLPLVVDIANALRGPDQVWVDPYDKLREHDRDGEGGTFLLLARADVDRFRADVFERFIAPATSPAAWAAWEWERTDRSTLEDVARHRKRHA
ncbi:hypothetical protein [Brachybacterium massiliense]|uniref:hypothetical protein n=1 Tax=Brachybacterium massiliense TaxID=1755098 RepID=UPI000B3BC864|nr:hypothetical protein [Brachybacterium massiliense]